MRRGLPCALLIAILLASCAIRHPRPAPVMPPDLSTDAEKDAAGKVWRDCLFVEEPKYDDFISDAGTVAHTIARSCDAEYDAYEAVLAQGEPAGIRHALTYAAPSARYEMSLKIVLALRARRQGLAPPNAP